MLTCKELTELTTDYLEGRLPLSRRVPFSLHVMMCRNCRNYLRQMKITVRTLRAIPAEPVPPEICEEMLKAFRTWKTIPRTS
jgi:predicted anti-sigma-YlaC factor YlaD